MAECELLLGQNKLEFNIPLSVYMHLYYIGQFFSIPATTTSYLNSQVQFTCGVEAPGILVWEVDNIRARFLGSRSISFSTTSTRQAATSTLYITASLANNNSEIACISISSITSHEIARAKAFLYIQGMYIIIIMLLLLFSYPYRTIGTTRKYQYSFEYLFIDSFGLGSTIFSAGYQQY